MTECPDLVLAERLGPVLLITLNRPERMNAWTDELEDSYFDLLDDAEADEEVKAIVLTGAGRGFCAGADMSELSDVSTGTALETRPRPRYYPRALRKPLIAAINGPAIGLGFVQAAYCDFRFAAPDARLATAFSRLGLIAEYGLSWLLPRQIGLTHATDLLLTGRMIEGEEAQRLGFVSRVVEGPSLVEEAVAFATELSTTTSPASVKTIKYQLRRHLESSFDQAFTDSEGFMSESFAGDDLKEGVAAYREQRPPRFAPLPLRWREEDR